MKDPSFPKFVLLVNGALPGALLAWDAVDHQLGPNPVNDAIHVTGATAVIFIALTLAVTPVRKITGWNYLSHFRRMLGLFAFFYALAHLAIYFAYQRNFSVWAVTQDALQHRFIFYGMAALLLMTPLALTSTNDMIKRLGAARWKRLHRLTYVVAILAAIHYWQNGKFVMTGAKIFAAAVALLLAWRIVQRQRDESKKSRLLPRPT